MNPIDILKEFGFPILVTFCCGWYIIQRTKFLEETLMKELDEDFKRLEGIIIALINQIKKAQLDLKHMKGYIKALEDIMTKLIKKEKKDV